MATPKHIAIIMDGNGRWARKREKDRSYGHYYGSENVRNIALEAGDLGVKILTLYAFSTENWKRPYKEIEYLMKLPEHFFDRYLDELMEEGVRVTTIGDLSKIPDDTRSVIEEAKEKTKQNDQLILNFALNYGGRDEIVRASKAMMADNLEEIDEEIFASYLDTAGLPDVDLLIRTGGNQRISNYLLWQSAYAELAFVDKHWPDFKREDFRKCVEDFKNRDRRFGGL